MKIKILHFKPDRIMYHVMFKTFKRDKLIHIRPLTFMCINRVIVMKLVYEFNEKKYKAKVIEKWS